MALNWLWSEKCGEAVIVQEYKNCAPKTYILNLYVGNAYLIFIAEWTDKETGRDMYNVANFWVDKDHMKRCLGLSKCGDGSRRNIHTDLKRIRLNKAKCRYWKQMVAALAEAFDDLTIEIYSETEGEEK